MEKKEYSAVSMYKEDKVRLEQCRKALLNDKPELRGMKITDAMLMHRMINYYLE